MDSETWLNVVLVLAFILIGGLFSGTEIALVSLRQSQIGQLERQSARGARVASVARDPNRFLAAGPDRRHGGGILLGRVRGVDDRP